MNVALWVQALKIIPKISKEEWRTLDVISRWLISTRAAVLVMTFISAAIPGLLALRDGRFHFGAWALLAIGLVLAHAMNNLLNDLTDFERGVDQDNYYRTQYGPQPLQQGLMTRRELLTYAGVTGALAAAAGLGLFWMRGWPILVLMAVGAFFVFFYTWPLKYIGLGEVAVILVWGPLMIGGGYYAITGMWDWNVVLAGLPYALGPTTVIFGKHIDKLQADKAKGIHTLPVIIGEKAARWSALVLMALQYVLVVALVLTGFFTPVMLVVLLALPLTRKVWPLFTQPRPTEPPADASARGWPMWFVAAAFVQNRIYGMLLLGGLVAEVIIRNVAG